MAEKYKVKRPAAKVTAADFPAEGKPGHPKTPLVMETAFIRAGEPIKPGKMEKEIGESPDLAIAAAGSPESTGIKEMAGKTLRMTPKEFVKQQGLEYMQDAILDSKVFKGKADKVFLFKYDNEGKMQEATETEEAGMMCGGAVEKPGKAQGGPVETAAEKKFQVTRKKLESDAGKTTKLMDGKELNAKKPGGNYDPNKVYQVTLNPDTKEIVSVSEEGFSEGGPVEAPDAEAPAVAEAPVPEAAAPPETPGNEAPVAGEEKEDDMTGPFAEFAKQGVDAELVAEGDRLFSALDEALSKNDEAGVQKYMDELKTFAGQVEEKRSEAVKQQNDTKLAAAYKEMAASAKDLLDAFQGMLAEQGGSPEAMAESAFQKEKAQVKAA